MRETATIRVCDCFPALREVTAAREQRYLADPARRAPEGPQSTVEVKVTSVGDLNERAESLKSGRAWTISEPKHVGGLADAPTPLEYLLSGAVGCFAAVFAFYAAKEGVDYDAFEATAVAEFDARGHMIEDAPPSGFSRVTIDVSVASRASEQQLRRLDELALAGCPGIATLRDPVALEGSFEVRP
ncbi:MAG: OsmC family protein [Actinomycetota bacterium]